MSKKKKSAAPRLPVLPSEPRPATKVRPSRRAKWRAATLVGVHLVIAAHIAHWLIAGRTVTPVEPSEAMAFAKGGVINAGLIFFAAAILLTAVFGRWFCGWGCHLVALQDLSRWLLEKIGVRPQPLRSRVLGWVPALAFGYMFLWPVAFRLAVGDSFALRGAELTTRHFWETFPGWVVGGLTFVVCGFACVYFLGAKGFCSYACPYGAAFAAADRIAPLRVRVTDACEHCGHCTSVCTSNVRVHEEVALYKMVVDPGCMKCGDCVSVCPNDALYFGFGRLPIGSRAAAVAAAAAEPSGAPPAEHRKLPWSEEATLGVAFLTAFVAFRGLFGQVPFLMSLGLAGVLAWAALFASRLARRREFAWRRWRLRSGGRLTPPGRLAVAGLAAVALVWLYAGALRAQAAVADRAYDRTADLRRRALDVSQPRTALGPDADRVAGAARAYDRLDRWSPVGWLGRPSRRAALAYLEGDPATFDAAAAAAAGQHDRSLELARLEARVAAERGDLARATAAGERAIALAPDRPELYSALGVLLAQGGAGEAAARVLERGRAHFPASLDLFYDSGVVSAIQGLPDQAIGFFARVIELEPDHPKARQARENLAGMLAQSGRYDEAIEQYRRAIDAAPGDLDLRVLRARALAESGRVAEARAELAAALVVDSAHVGARSLKSALDSLAGDT